MSLCVGYVGSPLRAHDEHDGDDGDGARDILTYVARCGTAAALSPFCRSRWGAVHIDFVAWGTCVRGLNDVKSTCTR